MENPANIADLEAPADLAGIAFDAARGWLSRMFLIREFETNCDQLSLAGKIPGGIHVAVGQEAVAVGVMAALKPTDLVAGGHRGHHHALACGLTPNAVMAELFGRSGGAVGGRGGTMHLSDLERGYIGGNGIVGAGVGLAMGAALASQMRRLDQATVGFVGDGGMNTGRTWESVNLAVIWKLPLIVVCENNLYAVETHIGRMMKGASIIQRATGFGIPAIQVDGQDVTAVYRVTNEARQRAAAGDGPTFIEAVTYRYFGHSTGEIANYRDQQEVDEWQRLRDPISRLRRALVNAGELTDGDLQEMQATAVASVRSAIAFADGAPWPDAAQASANVYSARIS